MPPGLVSIALVAAVLTAPATAGADADDFGRDLALLHRVVACGGDAAVPTAWTKVVEAHCKELDRLKLRFRTRYAARATRFFAALAPADLPTTVVYPFGGGDLASALIAFPRAAEITTVSLEHAGDPRPLAELDAAALAVALSDFRAAVRGLLVNNDSASAKMIAVERGPLPGQLAFFLTGAAALGLEPTGLRYFRLADDGAVDYLDGDEIAALATTQNQRKHDTWVDTGDSVAFDNAELTLRRADGSVVVHRHLAANLRDDRFADSPARRHLEAKGEVAAMTKAASYCLWSPAFSAIRGVLTAHAVYMVSDSTGLPPAVARRAGLEQITYGRFTGPYLTTSAKHGAATIALWASQPLRKLGFRFGYPDAAGNFHMMITRRKRPAAP